MNSSPPSAEVIPSSLSPRTWGSATAMLHPEAAECSVVLQGVLEYHTETDVYRLEEGDCIYLPANTPHRLYNPSEQELHAIAMLSPAYF